MTRELLWVEVCGIPTPTCSKCAWSFVARELDIPSGTTTELDAAKVWYVELVKKEYREHNCADFKK
jgi:hypothetical protein